MAQLGTTRTGVQDQLSHLMRDSKHLNDYGLNSLLSPVSSTATPLQVYETYLENGFISLTHKIRNMEKKKIKLENYKEKIKIGEELNRDQLEAVDKYNEVVSNLKFAKEFQKVLAALGQDLINAQKKAFRCEHVQRVEKEKQRLRMMLEIQYLLQSFSQDHVLEDFKNGANGAMHLTSKELDCLAKFTKLICHKRFKHMSLEDEMDQLSIYLWNLLEGNEKMVAGTNYKNLKNLVARMLDCGYFETVPDPPIPKKPEVLIEEPPKSETIKVDKAEPESFVEHLKLETHPQEVMLPFRHYVTNIGQMSKAAEMPSPVQVKYIKRETMKPWPVAANVKLQEPPKRWQSPPSLTPLTKPWEAKSVPQPAAPQPKMCELEPPKERRERMPKPQRKVKALTPLKDPKTLPAPSVQITLKKKGGPAPICISPISPAVSTARVCHQPAVEFCYSPTLPKDPELRKQKLEDLIDQIKGTYDFIQDSMLDFEFQSPKVASSRLLIVPVVTPPEVTESPKEQTVPAEEAPAPPAQMVEVQKPELVYSPLPQLPEAFPERSPEGLTSVPLQTEQLQAPKTPTKVPLLLLKREGTPLSTRSPPVSSHMSPFQGMQSVFKMSPSPLTQKEPEIKEPLCPPEYQLTYSTADLISEETYSAIQEVSMGSPFPSGMPPVSSGNLSCYTSTPNLMPRIPQQYMRTQGGILRGASHGSRVMTNGYRCPMSFKGPETFRPPQCPPNVSYGQAPFLGHDYSVAQYIPQDANSDLSVQRGSVSSAGQSTSRSWSNSTQFGNPEMEETFYRTDSGLGDCSMTPIYLTMSSQTATTLPVNVYPLSQPRKVAFSTARTSNFAPGTLDQPIVFDLLLNNLGDTFDFQVGRFICPVNGTYVFIFHILKLAVNAPLYVNLMKNKEVIVSAYANVGAPDHETASNHAILQLFYGDQIWLRLHRGAIYGSSWKYSTFSGYLLYED
ncbi:positive regulation of dendritic spine morphogenesis [Pristimantis euphronides]